MQSAAKLSASTPPFGPSRTRPDGCNSIKAEPIAFRRSVVIPPVPLSQRKRSGGFNSVAATSSDGLQKISVDRYDKQWMKDLGSGDASTVECSSLVNGCHRSEKPSSPREKLGSKWREYQGSKKWEGLLNPLDENLRREIIKYGEFVQATYSACDFDPQSQTYALCKYPKRSLLRNVGLGSCGYRVTQNIYATSSVRVPQWLTSMLAPYCGMDATRATRRTSWIGFVAVCDDEREVARLGRRDIVVAYRGTVTPLEWVENLKDILTPVPDTWTDSRRHDQPKVESGFWSLYNCRDRSGRSAASQVLDEIRRLVELYRGEKVSVTITGHSLGAALALVTAYQVGAALERSELPWTVFSFGGPRVGNRAFGHRMEEMGIKVLRIVNTQDVITKVPGVILNEWTHCHLMKRQRYPDYVKRIVRVFESFPWAYWHVGTELRVNSKHSPYLKPDADMSCCHDLEAYLHLIDGFSAPPSPSDRPPRETFSGCSSIRSRTFSSRPQQIVILT